jgi:HemY protein
MIALGLANLDAKLWGEARRHLTQAIEASDGEASAGLCRLMARVEEEENADPAAVHRWLTRAAEAPPDPAWVCSACGAAHARWQANCPRCGSFDKLEWRAPARVEPVLVQAEVPPALTSPEDTARASPG